MKTAQKIGEIVKIWTKEPKFWAAGLIHWNELTDICREDCNFKKVAEKLCVKNI